MIIEIVTTPRGEAPEEIRKSWIGLQLFADDTSPAAIPISHVITGPRSRLGMLIQRLRGLEERWEGYIVNARDAVEALAKVDPKAAAWWYANTGYLLDGKHPLVFDIGCCRVVQLYSSANLNEKP